MHSSRFGRTVSSFTVAFCHIAHPGRVADGYLPLRSAPCRDDSNEICKLWPGCTFYVDLNNIAYSSGYTYYFADYDGIRGRINASYVTILD